MSNLNLDLKSKLEIIEENNDTPKHIKNYSFAVEKVFKNNKIKYSAISPMNDYKRTSFNDTIINIEKEFNELNLID